MYVCFVPSHAADFLALYIYVYLLANMYFLQKKLCLMCIDLNKIEFAGMLEESGLFACVCLQKMQEDQLINV